MKNKVFRPLLCLLVCLLMAGNCTVFSENNAVDDAQRLIDDILEYKCGVAGASSVQGLIDGALTDTAGGSAEWYALALSQQGDYDLDRYRAALEAYTASHNTASASTRQKYALTLIAAGSTDGYIAQVLADSIGKQGVMSWVYGLHLLNNGYQSETYTPDTIINTLLDLQKSDGGWAVMGTAGDNDVTAMTLQALAPHRDKPQAAAAIDRALALLSGRQLGDGDYAGYGLPNAESTAQVMIALTELGVDFSGDDRFIKNGNTLLDGLEKYRRPDGSFSHAAGEDTSEMATAQALCAAVAYVRQMRGQARFYLLDERDPAGLISHPETPVEKPATSQPPAITDSAPVAPAESAAASTDGESSAPSSTAGAPSPAADTESADAPTSAPSSQSLSPTGQNPAGGYKLWVCLAIVLLAGVGCAILPVCKKGNRKNLILILAAAVLIITLVLVTDFQTTEDYYGQDSSKSDPVGSVTLTIRCDKVAGQTDTRYIPENGVILDTTEFTIEAGDTVYDVLTEAAAAYQIQVDATGTAGGEYVTGIQYLYEFDHGDLSGWVYRVNGERPSVGCNACTLQKGDAIEWLYTLESGNDLD